MGFKIQHFDRVDSTMRLAADLPVGSVVVASEQTAGVGRHGHSWTSPPGAGLYASIVMDPHPVLTLALGLAASLALRRVTQLTCDIRWPNDLLLNERKLGGILVQMEGRKAIAGIGINVSQRAFPPELADIATSLAIETSLEFRSEDILAALLEEIERHVARGAADIIAAWERASSYARGKQVRVDLGDRMIHGITVGLDDHGFLKVRKPEGGIEIVLAGGVRPNTI